jgi:hypothetical protein
VINQSSGLEDRPYREQTSFAIGLSYLFEKARRSQLGAKNREHQNLNKLVKITEFMLVDYQSVVRNRWASAVQRSAWCKFALLNQSEVCADVTMIR